MNLKFVPLLLVAVILWQCDSSTEPHSIATSGEVTVPSGNQDQHAVGFSFTKGAIISYPNSSDIIPDLFVQVHQGESGDIKGVFFSSDTLVPTFALLAKPSTRESAHAQFDTLYILPDSLEYIALALPIERHQIWAFHTRRNTYAKLLILATTAYIDSTNGNTPYGEATLAWEYQPDGTRQFDERAFN